MQKSQIIKLELPTYRRLEVQEIVTRAEGHLSGVFTADVEEPMIMVTGYYETVNHGWLDRFVVVLPRDVIRRETRGGVIYYHSKSKKKVIIVYGDAYDPSVARIKEMTNEDFEEIRKLQEVEKLIP